MAAATEAASAEQRSNGLILFDPSLGGVITLPSELYRGKGVPTIIFHAENNSATPQGSSTRSCNAARDCQFVLWKDGEPGFFNSPDGYDQVMTEIITFLKREPLIVPT